MNTVACAASKLACFCLNSYNIFPISHDFRDKSCKEDPSLPSIRLLDYFNSKSSIIRGGCSLFSPFVSFFHCLRNGWTSPVVQYAVMHCFDFQTFFFMHSCMRMVYNATSRFALAAVTLWTNMQWKRGKNSKSGKCSIANAPRWNYLLRSEYSRLPVIFNAWLLRFASANSKHAKSHRDRGQFEMECSSCTEVTHLKKFTGKFACVKMFHLVFVNVDTPQWINQALAQCIPNARILRRGTEITWQADVLCCYVSVCASLSDATWITT